MYGRFQQIEARTKCSEDTRVLFTGLSKRDGEGASVSWGMERFSGQETDFMFPLLTCSLCVLRGENMGKGPHKLLETETRRKKLTWAVSSGPRPLSWFSNAPHLLFCCLGIEVQLWFWIHCCCGWVGWFFWVRQTPVLMTLSLWDILSLGSVAFVLGHLAGPFLSYRPCSQDVAVWLLPISPPLWFVWELGYSRW